ncbi:MAG TPA: TMEM175 family protein [Ktedonobacteraceae bacterium]
MSSEQQAGAVAKETGRLEAFSDGVFAVAITLLVVTLQVPHLSEAISVSTLGRALLTQWPSYLAFMTSFATIFIMWASHHSIFKLVYKADTSFLFANGLLLLLVTVVPFPTSLVAQYLITPAAALACAIYAGVFVVINVAYNVLWWVAVRQRRLLHPAVTSRQVKRVTRNQLLGLPLYLLATLLAFWNPYVSVGLCSCLWIFWAFTYYERSPSPRSPMGGQDVETASESDT